MYLRAIRTLRSRWPQISRPSESGRTDTNEPALGLRRNWRQFWLLVVVNAFVGAMVGLERAVLPLLAEREFGIASRSAMLSFIVSFGIVKAVTNVFAASQFDRVGRKPWLVAGWLAGVPVPFLLLLAPSWAWVTGANVLLGTNQGLCWSATVVMKIDLVGPRRRGFAMGLNEFAGYGAVAVAAWTSSLVASAYGLRQALFVLGVAIAATGLVLSIAFVRDTTAFARSEARQQGATVAAPPFRRVFVETSVANRNLFAACQAGLVNNFNDGVAWGLFPLLFAGGGLGVRQIGELAALYPLVWSVSQIGTGALSDRWGRKWLIASGMWMQAAGIWITVGVAGRYGAWLAGSALLGLGTALVYPTLLAAVGDAAHPTWRASAVGVYRLWRDLGYAIGALVCGIVADVFGLRSAIALAGALTFGSGVVVACMFRARRSV
jgi:MFS family permease